MAKSRRWVVDARSPRVLAEVLGKMGADASAIADGRVFVDRVRARDAGTRLQEGNEVELFLASEAIAGEKPRILAQRGGIIAAYKPAGMATIPDQRGSAATLLGFVARETGRKSPSDVHTSSRLDTEVSGVVLLAIDEAARTRLQTAREQGRYLRHYVAIASAAPEPPEGMVDAPIGRASDPRKRRVGGPEAVPAQTRYRTIGRAELAAMIAAEPQTGRTHQIRVHMASRGAPLLGDPAYGGRRSVVMPSGSVREITRIALHAAWVQLEDWKVEAAVPRELEALWTGLGGAGEAWVEAARTFV